MDLVTRLKDIMAGKHLSARALGEMSGVSGAAITAILREERSPTMSTLEKLCSALGVTLPEFFAPVDANNEDFDMLADGTIVPAGTQKRPLADEISRDLYGLTDKQLLAIKAMMDAMKEAGK